MVTVYQNYSVSGNAHTDTHIYSCKLQHSSSVSQTDGHSQLPWPELCPKIK